MILDVQEANIEKRIADLREKNRPLVRIIGEREIKEWDRHVGIV
jgi:hypothetical protein